MASPFLSTPYTPIFPPPLPKKPARKCSYSDDDDDENDNSSSANSSADPKKNHDRDAVPYIHKLKERYLQLASIPHQLCAPSRENSPEAQTRVQSIRTQMRERRECNLPFELALTCVGVAGGDWVGDSLSDIDDDQYILPRSEADWFRWEKRRKAIREKRRADKQAQQRRDDIAKWTEGIQPDNTLVPEMSLIYPQSRPLAPGQSIESLPADLSPPAAPMLEPLHDINDSISGNSVPSLPFSISALVDRLPNFVTSAAARIPISIPSISLQQPTQSIPLPLSLPPPPPPPSPPRMTMIEQPRPGGTPSQRDHTNNQLQGTNPQLSSPISPPRSLKPLANMTQASFPVSSKRLLDEADERANAYPYDYVDADADTSLYNKYKNSQDFLLDTPRQQQQQQQQQQHRPNKRFKLADEPITPKSVERRTLSQLSQPPPPVPPLPPLPQLGSEEATKQLPTLTELIANSKKRRKSSSIKSSQTPHQDMLGFQDITFSSPIPYSMFMPQAHSTQIRALEHDDDDIVSSAVP